MIESSSEITGIRRKGAIRKKVTTLEDFPSKIFGRFKFSVPGERERDIVIRVENPI
jgi:hypothetical protein